MELVGALFTTVVAGAGEAASAVGLGGLISSGSATAGAAASAGSAAATAASTGLAWQGLQGTLTAGSMLMGAAQGIGSLLQAGQNATQAEIQAKQEALNIQKDYLIQTGNARVAFAGSGVMIGSGSEAATEQSLTSQADLQESLAYASGKAKAESDWTAGIMGAVAAAGGILKTGADYQISLAKRGLS